MAELVRSSRRAAAFELSALVNQAAGHLGVARVDLYVVDYSQRFLNSIDPEGDQHEIAIEGTVAGLAFTAARPAAANHDEETRTWWPLVDGTDRLGVALVVHGDRPAPDAVLDAFVGLVAEVLVTKNQYSDWFRRCRRRSPLTLSAESQWRQLPPLTLQRNDLTVAGALEPAYEMGGDAFDFAHNPSGLRFDLTDAMGHGVEAMLLSMAATAALRHSRAHELPLEETYRSADRVIAEQFGQSRFVTGIIGHLDPETSTLSWINAGHPLPLLVRDRSVTGTLACGPSLPLGLGGPVVEIGRHTMQPGDRVLMYTDGAIESRHGSEQFGLDRLTDQLERATLAGLDAPETLRRLALAVLAHSDYELADDASLLLLELSATALDDAAGEAAG
jgi:hypothetical protein